MKRANQDEEQLFEERQLQQEQMTDKFNIKLETLEDVRQELFNPELALNEKIKKKRILFLLKIPLLSLIYQKKGPSNFNIIVQNTKMFKTDFGDTIISSQEDRTFNIILRGTVIVFTKGKKGDDPKYNKKLTIGDHFGQKMEVEKERIESIRCASSCYLIQLDMKFFYHTFSGHFICEEFIERVNCLRQVWVFRKLKNSLLEKILLTSQHSKYVRGFVLFKEGEPVNHLLVILEGEATLTTTSQEGKQTPLSILTRFQVYGIQQLRQQLPYGCSGVCTSDYAEILKVEKNIIEEVFDQDILPETIISRKMLTSELKEIHSDSKRLLVKRSIQTSHRDNRRSSNYQHRRLRTQSLNGYTPLNKMEVLNSLFKREIQLKHSNLRGVRQQHIKNIQRQTLYSTKRISSYVNKDCTYDKEIILNYLEKKQRRYQSAINKEMKFQHKKIVLVPQLRVHSSSAVKNQKRKLKNSRKTHHSSLQHLC